MSVIAHQTEKEWISANEKSRQRMSQTQAEGAAKQHAARLEEAHLRAHHSCFTSKNVNQKQHIRVKHDFVTTKNREFKDYIDELKRLNQNKFPTIPSPSKAKRGTQKRSTTSVPGTSGKKQRSGERKRSGNTTPLLTAVVEETLSAMEDDSSADESSSEAITTKVAGPIDVSARAVNANGIGDLTDTEGDDFTVVARKKKVASIVIDASQNTTGLLNTLSEHLGNLLEGRFENGKPRVFPKTILEHRKLQSFLSVKKMRSHTFEMADN
ncbi:hypothetical protein TNCV_3911171 [Trichonephila clavipes]|nr:hypothetical protein TNCV_3911171 [Trichonephila clavipes]